MPLYEYACSTCDHKFDRLQPMGEGDIDCPRCGLAARRVISLFSALTTGDDGELKYVPSTGGGCACSAGGACGCSMN